MFEYKSCVHEKHVMLSYVDNVAKSLAKRLMPVSIILLSSGIPAYCTEPNQTVHAQAVLRTIIEGIKTTAYDYSGSGAAAIVIDENKNRTERFLDFKFKDVMSRSDAHVSLNGQKGDLDVIWSVNRENSVAYNGYNATVQDRPFRQFYRNLGYDFHPETFSRIHGVPLAKILENILNGASQIDIDIDNEGILNISAEFAYERDDASEHIDVALDTREDYLLKSWQHETKNLNGIGSRMQAGYTADWAKTKDHWYIKQIHFEENLVSVVHKGEQTQPEKLTYNADVIVDNFVLNPEIQDSEFTLTGLGLPHGTIVVDDIVGIAYKYGSGLRATQKLEQPLFEAELFKNADKTTGTKDVGGASSNAAETRIPGETALSSDPVQPARSRPHVLVALIVAVVLLLMGLLVHKTIRLRKLR